MSSTSSKKEDPDPQSTKQSKSTATLHGHAQFNLVSAIGGEYFLKWQRYPELNWNKLIQSQLLYH